LSYAYHGQSQQSSQVSQTLAYSGANHYSEVPASSVTFYHPDSVHAVEHYPTYLQPQQHILTSGVAQQHFITPGALSQQHIITPGAVTQHHILTPGVTQQHVITPGSVTYQSGPATLTHIASVQPRPVSEQAFSVNVVST
jgi:hypothetical protein